MPRLVRRQPLSERIMAAMNPMDLLLWISEEMETREWDSKLAGTQLGLALNFVFLLARANYGSSPSGDDIFGDDGGSRWQSFLVSESAAHILHAGTNLTLASCSLSSGYWPSFPLRMPYMP